MRDKIVFFLEDLFSDKMVWIVALINGIIGGLLGATVVWILIGR